MFKKRLLFLLLFLPAFVLAQKPGTLFGKITDSDGNPVFNANIILSDHAGGTTSKQDGTFELKVPSEKKYTVTFSFMGYESELAEISVKTGERQEYNRILSKSSTQLQSIEVKDQQIRTNTFNRLDPKSVSFIPTMNASVEDLIKTMPGVSSRNEMSSQYSVRGGNFDENLVFVNDIEVYRPFLVRSGQQEGQSFLNPDLVSAISFSAGGFDAKYGDKMSSVLDIRYKKPSEFAGSID
ncbi:MAG: TonB-dependent receptor, partial [Bacteroidota bacterium]